jgi:hypothetical protein
MCREWKCSGRKWRRGCRTGCWSAPHRRTSSTRTVRGGTTSACTRRSRKTCPTWASTCPWARCRPRTCSSSRASPTSTAPAHGGAERRAPQRQERAARRAARRAAAAEALAAAVTAAQGPGGVHGQPVLRAGHHRDQAARAQRDAGGGEARVGATPGAHVLDRMPQQLRPGAGGSHRVHGLPHQGQQRQDRRGGGHLRRRPHRGTCTRSPCRATTLCRSWPASLWKSSGPCRGRGRMRSRSKHWLLQCSSIRL